MHAERAPHTRQSCRPCSPSRPLAQGQKRPEARLHATTSLAQTTSQGAPRHTGEPPPVTEGQKAPATTNSCLVAARSRSECDLVGRGGVPPQRPGAAAARRQARLIGVIFG